MFDDELASASKNTNERREVMSEEVLDAIAARLEQRMYEQIGKGVVRRFLWVVGIISISVLTYLEHKGML